jgi:phosphoglycolate phosphatase
MLASNRRLLLFDIDGTLITSGGAGEGALMDAMKQRFGIDEDLEGITIAGVTDALIARMILEKNAVPASPENITALLDAYLSFLGNRLSCHSGCVLPGIVSLLDRLRERQDCVLALLTTGSGTTSSLVLLPTITTTETSCRNLPALAHWKHTEKNFRRNASL